MCGGGSSRGPWSAWRAQIPGPGNGLGPGNTNPGSDGWVGSTPSPVPTLPHHPGYPSPRWRRCTHHDEHARASHNRHFEVDQGDPRGRIRTVFYLGSVRARLGCVGTAATLRPGSPALPGARTPITLSISQYFSVFLSYRPNSAISQLYLSYISVICLRSPISQYISVYYI